MNLLNNLFGGGSPAPSNVISDNKNDFGSTVITLGKKSDWVTLAVGGVIGLGVLVILARK